jgi:hypothetical protein
MGRLRHRQALPGAQVGSLGPMVEQTEEQVLIRAAAADVEGRMNVLLRQLEDECSLLFPSFLPSFLLLHLFFNHEWNLVCQR